MSHELDGRTITCPICGKRGHLISNTGGDLHRCVHLTKSTFTGQATGVEVPVLNSELCDITGHVEEIIKKEMPSKRVGKK